VEKWIKCCKKPKAIEIKVTAGNAGLLKSFTRKPQEKQKSFEIADIRQNL